MLHLIKSNDYPKSYGSNVVTIIPSCYSSQIKSGFSDILEGYSDANWISDSDEIKSINGYVFTLGGDTVASKLIKQLIIVKSTME